MDEDKAYLATKECLKLRKDLHNQFATKLNSDSYVNGQIISVSGSLIEAKMWIKSGRENRILAPTEMANQNTRYLLTYQMIGSPSDPIRIGIDNCHRFAHLDVPKVEKGISIPVSDPNNIGMCGSVVNGITLQDSEIKDKINNYWLKF